MIDEFIISETNDVGSSGSKSTDYILYFERHNSMEIMNMTLDEIKHLAIFLSEFIKEKGGTQ